MVVKRENIKGKYFVVGRDKGKIVAKKRWTGKSIDMDRRIFKSNKTFDKNTERIDFSTVDYYGFKDVSKTPKKPKKYPFRFFIVGETKNGRQIVASSRTLHWNNIEEPKREATQRFRKQVGDFFANSYTEEDGLKFIEDINIVEQGVRYEARTF